MPDTILINIEMKDRVMLPFTFFRKTKHAVVTYPQQKMSEQKGLESFDEFLDWIDAILGEELDVEERNHLTAKMNDGITIFKIGLDRKVVR